MCVFCKIINKEIPCNLIYESDYSIAILDINPVTIGHTIVIPKVHSENALSMNAQDFANYTNDIYKVMNLLNNKLDAKGMNIISNINKEAGQEIFHTHFHIIPRYDKSELDLSFKSHPYDIEDLCKKINS